MSYTPPPRYLTKLRAVGGEADGLMIDIIDGARDVHVPAPPPISVFVHGEAPPAETIGIRFARYTRRCIFAGSRAAPESIEYLAPADMSDAEALRFLLERHTRN